MSPIVKELAILLAKADHKNPERDTCDFMGEEVKVWELYLQEATKLYQVKDELCQLLGCVTTVDDAES
jgi:hypothetical protein